MPASQGHSSTRTRRARDHHAQAGRAQAARAGRAQAARAGRAQAAQAGRRPTGRRGTEGSGIHLLRSRSVIQGLIDSSGVGPEHLVLDLGAGPGTLTAPLAATGARVLAFERDPAFVRRLHRRFDGRGNVRIVEGDLRHLPLPSRPYRVVASIPFNLSTALFRRLLGPLRRSMHGGDLVVEWGFAKRICAPVPRDLELAWWGARYEIEVVRRIPAGLFSPVPSVDCAHVRVRPRQGTSGRRVQHRLRSLLTQAYKGRAPMHTVEQWADIARR